MIPIWLRILLGLVGTVGLIWLSIAAGHMYREVDEEEKKEGGNDRLPPSIPMG